jgi:hypothetical protein
METFLQDEVRPSRHARETAVRQKRVFLVLVYRLVIVSIERGASGRLGACSCVERPRDVSPKTGLGALQPASLDERKLCNVRVRRSVEVVVILPSCRIELVCTGTSKNRSSKGEREEAHKLDLAHTQVAQTLRCLTVGPWRDGKTTTMDGWLTRCFPVPGRNRIHDRLPRAMGRPYSPHPGSMPRRSPRLW